MAATPDAGAVVVEVREAVKVGVVVLVKVAAAFTTAEEAELINDLLALEASIHLSLSGVNVAASMMTQNSLVASCPIPPRLKSCPFPEPW